MSFLKVFFVGSNCFLKAANTVLKKHTHIEIRFKIISLNEWLLYKAEPHFFFSLNKHTKEE